MPVALRLIPYAALLVAGAVVAAREAAGPTAVPDSFERYLSPARRRDKGLNYCL